MASYTVPNYTRIKHTLSNQQFILVHEQTLRSEVENNAKIIGKIASSTDTRAHTHKQINMHTHKHTYTKICTQTHLTAIAQVRTLKCIVNIDAYNK